MGILTNAINSIALGVEDYESSDPRRLISCTRNLFAGILLLFKHKLAEMSPPGSDEVLIKLRIEPVVDPSGLKWIGKGKKTVDVQQIKERFNSLNIAVDWKRVDEISRYRNDIEHYHSHLSHDAVRSMIANSFLVIRDFVRLHLGQDPLELLGAETWETLTDVAEVYDREKAECVANIERIEWKHSSLLDALVEFHCSECGSGLIDVTNESDDRWALIFNCRSCGSNLDFETIAEQAIQEYYRWDNYSSVKDGGDPATISCPECGLDTYILEENLCVVCEASVETECQRCGMTIPPEEIDGEGYCSWCSHMMSKDD